MECNFPNCLFSMQIRIHFRALRFARLLLLCWHPKFARTPYPPHQGADRRRLSLKKKPSQSAAYAIGYPVCSAWTIRNTIVALERCVGVAKIANVLISVFKLKVLLVNSLIYQNLISTKVFTSIIYIYFLILSSSSFWNIYITTV